MERTHDERRDAAVRTFERFVPGADPERVARSMYRRLGPLGSFAFDTVGEMWDRPGLSRRDRSLMVIATLASQARDDELELHTQVGLRHGLAREEIEEVLPQVAAYAGFPAAMAASRSIDAGLRAAEGVERLSERRPAESKGDAARDADATAVRARMLGVDADDHAASRDAMVERLGSLGELAHRWAFGEVWARTELSPRDRSLIVIAVLVSLGAEAQLRVHIGAGLRHGLTEAEIEEVITHLALYCGFPRAVTAMGVFRDVRGESPAP